ncbi:UNVERIFIED_CONTAM: hypothetical protein GTU68_031219, partial [Idotea baltica]|nr:hypothetical protein [Idotea baltica]
NLFHIQDSAGKYRLKLGYYHGDAGDSLKYDNEHPFTTKDADHDSHSGGNCAEVRKGAWWYKNCSLSNLNGFQHRGSYEKYTTRKDGIFWKAFRGYEYSLKSTQLSVRPRLEN